MAVHLTCVRCASTFLFSTSREDSVPFDDPHLSPPSSSASTTRLKMLFSTFMEVLGLQLICSLYSITHYAGSVAGHRPEYKALPLLREQASLENAWKAERISNIPKLLQKYGVDAWLVSQTVLTIRSCSNALCR